MKPTRIFIITLLTIITLFLSPTFAENYTRWELPEGAKFRLGKGKISNYEGHLTTIGKGSSYHFSPDSTQLAVMTSIGIWVYDVMTGKEISLSPANVTGINKVLLTPDFQTYALPQYHKIEVRDLTTNQLKTTLENSTERIISTTFSPDGQTLASPDFSDKIRLWNIDNGTHRVIPTPHKIVGRVMFSPDGKTLVSSRDDEVLLWDIKTEKWFWDFKTEKFKANLEDTTGVDNIVFNPDGSALYGLTKHGDEVRFWDTNTGKVKLRLGLERTYRRPFALSPDGKTFATASRNDYKVQLWDTQTGKLKNTLTADAKYVKMPAIVNGKPKLVNYATKSAGSMAFSPDGKTLAVASDGEITLWDPETAKPKFILTENESFYYLMFSPDGRTLAARCSVSLEGSRIYLWNIDTQNIQNSGLRHIISDHNDEVSSVTFNHDAKILASGHNLEKIKLWDVVNGQLKTTCDGYPYQLRVQSLAFIPNAETLASLNIYSQSSGGIAHILLWDAITGKYQKTLKGHGKAISNIRRIAHGGGIAFSPNGKLFVTGSLDGTIRLWNTNTAVKDSVIQRLGGNLFGPQKAKLKGHTHQILSIALSPDGDTIASGSMDKTIRLWDVQKRKLIATLEGHTDEIWTVAFSPDGLTLATGCRSGSIHLWNPTTGNHKTSLIGNDLFTDPPGLPRKKDDPPNVTLWGRSAVTSLVFSPDGKTLLNGNSDGTIHFWKMSTLQIKSTLSEHSGLNSLAISPDGRTLASGSSDGTVLIWELEP
ncbi:MAG: WD40 repeat domain-containing protein [Candidatus Poribacteria bacterium]|nr:WD40 repeat domain-containing protein [Candidatus Poribacteria bacterium]